MENTAHQDNVKFDLLGSTNRRRNLALELEDAFGQFTRYGDSVENEKIMDIINELVEINDDFANGRDKSLILESIEKIKQLLDELPDLCV